MRTFLSISTLTLLLAAAAPARAVDCSCDAAESNAGPLLTTTTNGGQELKLRFDATPNTNDPAAAALCTPAGLSLKHASLWMPDMGHGSAPVKVQQVTATCSKLTNLQFIMGGSWDVRLEFNDGDKGLFQVDVE